MSTIYEDLVPYLKYLDVNLREDYFTICSGDLYRLLGSSCYKCIIKNKYKKCPLSGAENIQKTLNILKEKHPELFI